MIIRSAFRRAGGLGRHLTRTDTNERVEMRLDLARNAPADIRDALAVFTAIARTNARTNRDLIHFKMSPGHPLTEEELVSTLAVIEEEHAIPGTMPRYVVTHVKGERAQHYHVVFPLVDPASGRAIRSNENYLKDEIASRRLEVMFGEAIVPGPRQNEVIAEFAQRGMDDAVRALGGRGDIEPGQRIDGATRQQADRLGINVKSVWKSIYDIWIEAGKDWTAYEQRLDARGFSLARGDKAIMIIHRETGFHAPLGRLLRQAAKTADSAIKLPEKELRAAFPKAQLLAKVRDDGFVRARGEAHAAVDQEFGRMIREAELDAQEELAVKLRKARERAKELRKAEFRTGLEARREEIRGLYRRRDRIRRARVNRAFIAAQWFDTPGTRRRAFIVAGAGVLFAGGGLGLAFVVAGLALSMLPSYERARTLAYQAKLEQQGDWTKLARDLDTAYQEMKVERPQPRASIDFDRIQKPMRIIAGKLAWEAIQASDTDRAAHPATDVEIYRRAIGPDLARDIEHCAIHGSGRAAMTMLRWYRSDDAHDQVALAAAMRAAGAAPPALHNVGTPQNGSVVTPGSGQKPDLKRGWER